MSLNKLLIILLLGVSLESYSQSPVDTFGTWGYLPATEGNFIRFNDYQVSGYHILLNWKDVKPTYAGAYNFAQITLMIDSAILRNKFVGILTLVGNNAPQWVMDSVGSYSTEGGNLTGPYPKYYNPKHTKFFYQFLKDVAGWMNTLSTARKNRILYWQIAEGSTGDEQPYKGVLDACQVTGDCNAADTAAHPALGDPYVPQSRFETAWGEYRKRSWDTLAMSAEYTAISNKVYLMFNSGNNGSDLDYVQGDSTETNDNYYIQGHFKYLPLQPYIKEGQLSHVYSFRGETSYYNRETPPSRGEVQGYLKINHTYSAKELFFLVCSALTGGLSMLNIDQGWPPVVTGGTPPSISNFFMRYTNTKSEGFSIPVIRPDVFDTTAYPTDVYGALIDPAREEQYQRALYNYNIPASATGYNEAYVEWQYLRVVDKNKNPARVVAINALYPTAMDGNQTDSIYWNDQVTAVAKNYGRNLRQVGTVGTVIPVYRAGKDTALLGRFAGKPKLDGNNRCKWYYDIDNLLMNPNTAVTLYGAQSDDTVQVVITYLENGSGGSISLSALECDQIVTKGTATTVTANSGDWKTKTVNIPNFLFRTNSYDFMLDFVGDVTIGMVQVNNLNKE